MSYWKLCNHTYSYIYIYIIRPSRRVRPVAGVVLCTSIRPVVRPVVRSVVVVVVVVRPLSVRPIVARRRRRRPSSVRTSRRRRPSSVRPSV